uniref:C-SKI_SMAD_bind domain-containing protein n=1 Tax=Parastrongyloides trichosuri TaxID=131310 RepID=A0A0N4Z7E1_PARTI
MNLNREDSSLQSSLSMTSSIRKDDPHTSLLSMIPGASSNFGPNNIIHRNNQPISNSGLFELTKLLQSSLEQTTNNSNNTNSINIENAFNRNIPQNEYVNTNPGINIGPTFNSLFENVLTNQYLFNNFKQSINNFQQNSFNNLIGNQSLNLINSSNVQESNITTTQNLANSNTQKLNTIRQGNSINGQELLLINILCTPIEDDSLQIGPIHFTKSQQLQLVEEAKYLSSNAPTPPTKEVVKNLVNKRKMNGLKEKMEGIEILHFSTVGDYLLTSFIIGGEPYISFSEFSNTVLPHIGVSIIYNLYQKFNILPKYATAEQMMTLKLEGKIPHEHKLCSLITKSNAEKLTGYFLCNIRDMSSFVGRYNTSIFIKVIHNLFGGNTGYYYPHFPKSHCIQCLHCQFIFGPKKFLIHSHSSKSEKISTWGFDSKKWRQYYSPPTDEKVDLLYVNIFKKLIVRNNHLNDRKRKVTNVNNIDIPIKIARNGIENLINPQNMFHHRTPNVVETSVIKKSSKNLGNSSLGISQNNKNLSLPYNESLKNNCFNINSLTRNNLNLHDNNCQQPNMGIIPKNNSTPPGIDILMNQLLKFQNYVDEPNKPLIECLASLIPPNHLPSILKKLGDEFTVYTKEINMLKEKNKEMEKLIRSTPDYTISVTGTLMCNGEPYKKSFPGVDQCFEGKPLCKVIEKYIPTKENILTIDKTYQNPKEQFNSSILITHFCKPCPNVARIRIPDENINCGSSKMSTYNFGTIELSDAKYRERKDCGLTVG